MRHELLHQLVGMCGEAIAWAEQFDTLDEAWQKCERGDQMLKLQGLLAGGTRSKSRKRFIRATAACTRLALPFAGENKAIVLHTIETLERWATGKATLAEVRAAGAVANAAWGAAGAAWGAASAAGWASAADAAAYAAVWASAAARNAAAGYAAGARVFRECADIVRKFYPHINEKGISK
jgi:hypothetical protein